MVKEDEIKKLEWRKSHKPKQIDNGSLVAGSPMYFYCINCGHTSDILPENYLSIPKKLCRECQKMKDMGWL